MRKRLDSGLCAACGISYAICAFTGRRFDYAGDVIQVVGLVSEVTCGDCLRES